VINPLAISVKNIEKTALKVLLIFNKLSDYRNEIYDGFLLQIGGRASVDLYIHSISNQNSLHFAEVIRDKINHYDFVAIMLHATHINDVIL